MTAAVESVDGGIAVVSSFFKRNYNKYCRLWNKLDKHYNDLDNIFGIWDSVNKVLDTTLGKDDLLWAKSSVYFDNESHSVKIYQLSDYEFNSLILVLEEKCKWFIK